MTAESCEKPSQRPSLMDPGAGFWLVCDVHRPHLIVIEEAAQIGDR